MHRSWQKSSGFTLIELLVVVMIMILIMGSGIAAYIGLNNRQTVITAGKNIQNLMRTAQKKARVGDKPAGCQVLNAYAVVVPAGTGTTATLQAVCSNSTYSQTTYEVPNTVTTAPAVNMQFLGLRGGVTNPGTITITSGIWQFTFAVGSGGDITEGSIVRN